MSAVSWVTSKNQNAYLYFFHNKTMNPFHFIFCCCWNVNSYRASYSFFIIVTILMAVFYELLFLLFHVDFFADYDYAFLAIVCILFIFLEVYYTEKRARIICEAYNMTFPILPKISTLVFICSLFVPMFLFFYLHASR